MPWKGMIINMATEKHLTLTGISDVSWKDAITSTVAEASKTIDYLTSITVLEQSAKINGKKIVEYRATVDLCFMIDKERDE